MAKLRGEDTKGFRNYIVSRNPSVKWRPVRTEPSIYKSKSCWSRDSENEPYTPWHNRIVSVAYPLHIRFIAVAFPWSTGTSILATVNHGKDTVVSRSLRLHYVCAAVIDGHLRLVTEKFKFSNNLKIVSRKERAYGSTAVYPGLSRITTVMSTANVRNCHGYLRFETVGFRHPEPWKCNKGFMVLLHLRI